MNKLFCILVLTAIGALSCTLSVSDKHPKPASVFGAGQFAPSISNGKLVLTGSGLHNVSSIRIGDTTKVNMEISSKSTSVLTATLPAALTLPTMLWLSYANAEETPVALNALGALSVDGTLSVTGKTNIGFKRESNLCVNTNNPCAVDCTGGRVAVAGGCNTNNTPLTVNYPSGDSQWTCRTSVNANVEAWVICANVTLN